MTLSCKEVTATMAQELEQPIYVKPNRGDAYEFDSGEWKTVSGEFRMFFLHYIVDLQRDTARNPEWLMRVFILFLPATSRTK